MGGDRLETLGVVGGGQLGRMLAEAAAPLDVELVVSDPTPDAPAAILAREQVVGDFDDPETIRAVAERSDAVTFEIELTDPDALERVARETGVPVHPSPDTLRVIQDKLVQNERLAAAGIPVPAFRRVDDEADLRSAIDEFGYPVMAKARRGGYDGRGNFLVESDADAATVLDRAPGDVLVEQFVEFDRELSVIGVKGDGERATFPAAENVHEAEILRETIVPARTSRAVRDRAQAIAGDVLDLMDGRGVYGIELFEADGDVLVNEIAPRPHNSGHYTIEGAYVSQFEQHVRAVAGWPLGPTAIRDSTVTSNVLGDVEAPTPADPQGLDRVLETPGAALHWYGKREVRPLRKMGHVTVVPTADEDRETLLRTARELTGGITFRGAADGTSTDDRLGADASTSPRTE